MSKIKRDPRIAGTHFEFTVKLRNLEPTGRILDLSRTDPREVDALERTGHVKPIPEDELHRAEARLSWLEANEPIVEYRRIHELRRYIGQLTGAVS